jgi:hypothetical protein
MGKTTDSKTTNTQYSLDPQQTAVRNAATAQYMPGGQLPQGHASVAPLSTPTLQAFGATEANYGAQQPTMDYAKDLTAGSAGPAGQVQGSSDGWTTGADGQAHYQGFNAGVNRYLDSSSPFTTGVIDQSVHDLGYARDRANLSTDNDSVAKGSFGGTRQAVRNALNDKDYANAVGKVTSDERLAGYTAATGQYNTGFDQGGKALTYNTGVAQANRTAAAGAGKQLGDQAGQNQLLTGNDINALGNVGGKIETQDQAARDAAATNANYGLTVASSLEGLGPPPNSTANTDSKVSSGSIWGSIGGAAAQGAAGTLMLSDERAKTGVESADPHDSLAEIRKLKPKKFEYTDFAQAHAGAPSGARTGFMAQDMERATGKPAPQGAAGFKSIDTQQHLMRLTQAVQALDEQMRGKYTGKRKAA